MTAVRPKRVNWADANDLRVAMLGAMGFSTAAIIQHTGYSPCQVTYRLSKAKIRRTDYRNGESAIAKQLLRRHGDYVEAELLAKLNTV